MSQDTEVAVIVEVTWTAPDGVTKTLAEEYMRIGDEGPKAGYFQKRDGKVQSGFAYCGMQSDLEFVESMKKKLLERLESMHKAREDERERAELRAWFDAQRPQLERALDGLGSSASIIEALGTAVEWYGARENLQNLLQSSTAKVLRATLRTCYSAAREYTRENYIESYRDADDKDDFYDDFKDDVAQAFAAEL